MAIILTDDGTLDTVLRCEECGEEMRYNYDGGGDDCPVCGAGEFDGCMCALDKTAWETGRKRQYDEFVQECIDDATEKHACPAAPGAEPTEPWENDITTSNHETFYQNGKRVLWTESRWNGHDEPSQDTWYYSESGHRFGDVLGTFGDDHRAALRAYMDRVQFWSDVWFISDHGNAHRIDLTEGKE